MIRGYIKNPFVWSTVISVCALTGALVLQYGFGVPPCDLCLWQRGVYAVLLVVSLAALMSSTAWTLWLAVLGVVVSLAGVYIAVYHVGLEQHWWVELGIENYLWPLVCSGGVSTGLQDFQAFKEQIMQQGVVLCDEVTWSFLGISLAGYNVIIFVVLACLMGYSVRRHLGSFLRQKEVHL